MERRVREKRKNARCCAIRKDGVEWGRLKKKGAPWSTRDEQKSIKVWKQSLFIFFSPPHAFLMLGFLLMFDVGELCVGEKDFYAELLKCESENNLSFFLAHFLPFLCCVLLFCSSPVCLTNFFYRACKMH